MAETISRYNHTAKLTWNKEIDYSTLKVMLLTDDATFTAGNTTLAQVTNTGAYQVSGNGWTAGGITLASAAITTVATNGSMLDAADISITATGGDIGPAYKAVIYDDTHANDAPLWFIDFDGAKTAGEGTPFLIRINANGISRLTSA